MSKSLSGRLARVAIALGLASLPIAQADAQSGGGATAAIAKSAFVTARANAAVLAKATLLPPNNLVCTVGDSRPAQNYSTTALPTATTLASARGVATWAYSLSGGRIYLPPDGAFAVAGTQTISSDTSPQVASAIAHKCGTVLVWTDTNDRTVGALTAAQTIANLTSNVILPLVAANKNVLIVGGTPRGYSGNTSVRLSQPQLDYALAVHRWILATAPTLSPRVRAVDFWPVMADKSYNVTTGDAIGSYTADALHQNGTGAYLEATVVTNAVLPLMPPASPLVQTAASLYSSSNPQGSLLTGGLFGGTGGTGSCTGLTPNPPSNWFCGSTNATGLTVAGSYVTRTSDNTYWYQLAFSGTVGASEASYNFSQSVSLSNVSAGDVLAMDCAVEVDAASTGLEGPTLNLQASLPSSNSRSNRDHYNSGGDAWPATGLFSGVLHTPALTVAGTETALTAYFSVFLKASTTASATVRFGQCSVTKQ